MDERLLKILKNHWSIPVAVGILAFSSGAGLGYILGLRRGLRRRWPPEPDVYEEMPAQLELPFDEPIEYTLSAEIVQFDGTVLIYSDRESDQQRIVENDDILPEKFVTFVGSEDWDYYVEMAKRSENGTVPYVLHYDEFMNDELSYDQSTLTYFHKDNILCDEEDVPIHNYEAMTGPLLFGHGSNDPNVVYIRNERLKAEWEILFNDSSFAQDVLGLEIEEDLSAKGFKHGIPRFKLE